MSFFSNLLGSLFNKKKTVPKVMSEKKTAPKPNSYPADYFTVNTGQLDGILASLTLPQAPSQEVLNKIRQHIQQTPKLPTIWGEIQQAIGRGDSAKSIANIVQNDPALATEILKSANSAGFANSKEINDVGQAIVRLGFQAVRGIATHYCTSDFSKQWNSPFSIKGLWKHSMAVSILSGITSRHISGCNRGVANTLGLLHDIGRLGLNSISQMPFHGLSDEHEGFLKYEHDHFECTHIDAGILLAQHWGLPEALQDGIRFHHHPALGSLNDIPEYIRKEVFAVYLADFLAIHFGFSGGNPHLVEPHASFATLLNTSLNNIAHDPAIAKELWRIQVIDF